MNSRQRTNLDGTLDQALDRALSDERDSILPSLGFTDSVMAVVRSEGPAPLRFPWKRALPGLIAGIAALVGFAGASIWVLERTPATAPAAPALDWKAILAPVLQRAVSPDTTWILVALLIPVVSLWLTRRLLFSR
jgi:hypothetical protein